ncbi:MAG: alpha/beta hydrolase [Pseudomonadota bacterium]
MRRIWRRTALVAASAFAMTGLGLSACSGPAVLNYYSDAEGLRETRDIAYGAHPRQTIDLYQPDGAARATLIFVHGGSWYEGDPDLYPFLGRRFAALGYRVAIPGYRVAPEVIFPSFVEDIAAATMAIRDRLGPDAPLFLMGHSAGAHLAALVVLDPRYLGAFDSSACEVLAGFVGLAGPYDFLPLRSQRYKRIFPEAIRAQTQPVAYADRPTPPMLLIHGKADRVVHAEDSAVLAKALRAAGNDVTLHLYPQVNHTEIIGAISPLIEGWAPTTEDILAFLARQESAGFPGCAGRS